MKTKNSFTVICNTALEMMKLEILTDLSAYDEYDTTISSYFKNKDKEIMLSRQFKSLDSGAVACTITVFGYSDDEESATVKEVKAFLADTEYHKTVLGDNPKYQGFF